MTTENIWVKRGTGISAFGAPLIVMAAQKSGQQHWIGEYYILLGGRYPAFIPWVTGINAKNVPENIATIDAEYMKIELDQHSASALSIHCFDLYEETKKDGLLNKLEFLDGEKTDILRAWLRGQYSEDIRRMHQLTKIDSLRSYLQGVVHLTPMVSPS